MNELQGLFLQVALLAQIFAILMNLYSLKKKAKKATLIFKYRDFFEDDWLRIAAILCIIWICILALPFAKQKWSNFNELAAIGFASFVGYAGTDFALKVFGFMNKRFNAAIDSKTNQADEANGTLGIPTPAAKPAK